MRKLLLGSVLLLASTAPAVACVNDRETVREEQEFKSRYLEEEPEQSGPVTASLLGPLAGSVLGGLLLGGAVVRARRGAAT